MFFELNGRFSARFLLRIGSFGTLFDVWVECCTEAPLQTAFSLGQNGRFSLTEGLVFEDLLDC